jgi:hypothetical protein
MKRVLLEAQDNGTQNAILRLLDWILGWKADSRTSDRSACPFAKEQSRRYRYFCAEARSRNRPLAEAACVGLHCLSLVGWRIHLISLRVPLHGDGDSSVAFTRSRHGTAIGFC